MTLDEQSVGLEPLVEVERWLAQAFARGIPNAEAMALATATPGGAPSVRFVLLRGLDERGFTFFTSYASRKGRELSENPEAAIALYWVELGRQVRASGRVERVSREESQAYFDARPLGSRIAASISRQSEPVASRAELERRYAELEAACDGDVPLPGHWGGYRLVPAEVELWEHRESRLHDRIAYTRIAGGTWRRERLEP